MYVVEPILRIVVEVQAEALDASVTTAIAVSMIFFILILLSLNCFFILLIIKRFT